jgi:hypothetical protein
VIDVKQRTAELVVEASIPTVSGLVSSKRLRKIELQFDVEAMSRGASDEG